MDIEHFMAALSDLAENTGNVLGDIDDVTIVRMRKLTALLYAAIEEEEHTRAAEATNQA